MRNGERRPDQQLVRRKPGWPVAVATLVLSLIAVGCGGVGYAMAVG